MEFFGVSGIAGCSKGILQTGLSKEAAGVILKIGWLHAKEHSINCTLENAIVDNYFT